VTGRPSHRPARAAGAKAATLPATSRTAALWLALPLCAAFLVYFNALSGEFVYDDNDQLLKNPWVHELRYLPDLLARPVWAYQTTEPTNYYRPVQMGLYNLLWAAFGPDPFYFHVLSLLFHLLCTSGLFFLVHRISREPRVAAAAALLFAVHPLNTEAVAWIACLPELTYSFFVLAAILLHLRSWSAAGPRRLLGRALAITAFVLAMFSKETGLTLLLFIVLLEIWIRPLVAGGSGEGARAVPPKKDSGAKAPGGSSWTRAGREAVPYALAATAYLAVRTLVIGGFAPRVRAGLTPFDALLNAPVLLLSYLRAMLVPIRLVAFHVLDRVESPLDPLFLAGLAAVALAVFGILRLSKHRPDLAFAGALALVPFLPVLYIPAVGENAFAERYAYLPTAGMAWLVAGAAAWLLERRGLASVPATVLAGAAVLALPCAARTVTRNADWHDDLRFTAATLREEPRAWRMVVLEVNWHYRHDQFEKALEAIEKGVAAFPESPVLQVMAANTRLLAHRISPQEAIADLERIAAANPYYNEAQYSLGGAYLKANRPADAIAVLQKVVSVDSNDEEAINRLGVAYAQAGRQAEARAEFERALRLDPSFGKARRNLERLDHRGSPPAGD
jgi:protein O-mannosyl-transferase